MNKEKFLKLAKQAILKNYEPNRTYSIEGAPIWYDYDNDTDTYKAIFPVHFGYQDNVLLVKHSSNWDDDTIIRIVEYEECRFYSWNF